MLDAQIKHLANYLKSNRLDIPYANKYPLFPNSHNQKLTRAGVAYILKKYADIARKKNPELIPAKISPHSLRHSKAMHLLQAGVPLIYIRDILGHVSVQTTELYARVETKQKIEAIEKTYTDLIPNIFSIGSKVYNMIASGLLEAINFCFHGNMLNNNTFKIIPI